MSDASALAHLAPYSAAIAGLRNVGHQCWQRGWSRGTSSNYSVVIQADPLRLLVTASGKDKGHLAEEDFVIVDEAGQADPAGQPKSSAETLLHCSAARHRGAGAVLHTHSPWSTVLSHKFAAVGGIEFHDYEMLKGLSGITTHRTRFWLPIYDNTQDIPALARQVEAQWQENPQDLAWGYLIRRHGLYTWGVDLPEAIRHLEVLEFLLECFGTEMSLK